MQQSITSVIFLQKTNNLNLITRKPPIHPRGWTLYNYRNQLVIAKNVKFMEVKEELKRNDARAWIGSFCYKGHYWDNWHI